MKKYIIDISGKVERYDMALFSSLKRLDKEVYLYYSGHGLLSFIPSKYYMSLNLFKRGVKALESICNYLIILFLSLRNPASIFHFQWLPFLEICQIDIFFLIAIKKLNKRNKIVLTIHNVFPHNYDNKLKDGYANRFKKANKYIDEYIVHTDTSRSSVINEFNIPAEHVNVCFHGVFEPDVKLSRKEKKEVITILQFGGQSYYKGTDLLVKAGSSLKKSGYTNFRIHFVGVISDKYLSELKEISDNSIIDWKPYFVSDEELYDEINNSDIVVLPYRDISQSGVLLLSIYFEKLVVCSNLPSFVETLNGGMDQTVVADMLFESNSYESLSSLLQRYLNGNVNIQAVYDHVIKLKSLYSWNNSAIQTLRVYDKLSN